MNNDLRSIRWIFWGTLPLVLFGVFAVLWLALQKRAAADPIAWVNFPLPDFILTNQDNRPIALADLRGQVWIADIVFTRCAGPCPVMTRRLSDLQTDLFKNRSVKFVTLTTDPEYDTPAEMKRFGERFNADFKNWYFLTGEKKQIARLAVDGLKLVIVEKNPSERENEQDIFIHSTRFVIVDKKGAARASFDSEDPRIRSKVLQVVRKLAREPSEANPQLSSRPH